MLGDNYNNVPEIGKLYMPKILRNPLGQPVTIGLYYGSQKLNLFDELDHSTFLLVFIQNSHGPFCDISSFASTADFGFRYKFLWNTKIVWTEPIAGFRNDFFNYFVPYRG